MSDLDREALGAAMKAIADETDRDEDDYYVRKLSKSAITAYLSALSEKGVRLMPREATPEMIERVRPLFQVFDGGLSDRFRMYRHLEAGGHRALAASLTDDDLATYGVVPKADRAAMTWRGMFDSFANLTDAVSQTATEQNPNQHGGGET